MAKKTTAPTAIDSGFPEPGRERLPSAFLVDEVSDSAQNFPAKASSESMSEQGAVRRSNLMDASFISNLEPYAVECPLGQSRWRLAQLEKHHQDICEVQSSAFNSSLRDGSKDKVLSTLRVTSAMLGQLRQNVISDPQLSMSVQMPKSVNILPVRTQSPPSRQFMGYGIAPPLESISRQTSLHDLPRESDDRPFSVLQTRGTAFQSDAILEVPEVVSVRSPTSPQKSWKFENPKFEPIMGNSVRPFFQDAPERPQVAPGLQPFQGKKATDFWASFKQSTDATQTPIAKPSFGRLPANVTLDPTQKSACERLTQFLRTEVTEGGNLELSKLLLKIQRRC